MQVHLLKIDDLKPAEYNPRKMTEKEASDLMKSLKDFDFAEPIVVNQHIERKNVIVGGHQRVEVARRMGKTEVPCVFVNLPLVREKELNLRLNRNLGSWDYDLLLNIDKQLLIDVGFESTELDKIFGVNIAEDNFDVEKEYEKIEESQSKYGEVYQLGSHRLMCGDATKREDVEKLMCGKKANMIFTDPPYNVNYNYAKYEGIHRGRKRKFLNSGKIFNDKKSEEQFYHFLLNAFTNVYDFSEDDMSFYVCYATKTELPFRVAFEDAGFLFSQTIIWLKERIILALGQDYHRIYEPILFGWKKGKQHYKNKNITTEKEFWTLDRNDFEECLDLWYLHRDKSIDYVHPTQKPVRLPERALKKNSRHGDIIYEPFTGSGSTLIACEQLMRTCYALELDPKYCDVIVKRWEKLTGRKAQKLNQ